MSYMDQFRTLAASAKIAKNPEMPLPSPKPESFGNFGNFGPALASGDEFAERVALASSLSGDIPDNWRVGFARLQTMPPSSHFTDSRWYQIVNDAGLFLDRWGVQAAALDWQEADLFHIDQNAPAHRYDGMGLCLLIRGGDVVAITANSATIRTSSGAMQRFYRQKRHAPGLPLWLLEI